MEVRDHVVSAARAVLDMVEREWQPLSAGELELRLDQAVEEVLESELRAQLEAQSAPLPPAPPPAPPPPLPSTTFYLQLVQSQTHAEAPVVPTAPTTRTPEQEPESEQGAAVKYISDLLQSSESGSRLAGRARLSLPHTVLLSLTLLSQRLSYRCVSRRFRLEKGNIHRIFFSFCERVNALQEKIICWPEGEDAVDALVPFSSLLVKEEQQQEQKEQEEQEQEEEQQQEEQEQKEQEEQQEREQQEEKEEEQQKEQQEEQVLPQVLGVLGHTRVPIRLPTGKQEVASALPEVKRMRTEAHPDSWLNVELVCDRRGRFLHCGVSRGSDAERGGALADRLRRNPALMPPGSVLAAGAGYPLSARVLTPYAGGGGPREELFNKTLEEHLRTLDRAVAALRARFRRLRYLDIGNYERARAVALAACVLHNVFVDIGQEAHGAAEREEAAPPPPDRDVDEEGVRTRDAVAELLFAKFKAGSA